MIAESNSLLPKLKKRRSKSRTAGRVDANLSYLIRMRQELSGEYEQCWDELADDEHNEMDHDCSIDCQSDGLLASALEHLAQEIRSIDSTLKRICDGTYGICAGCGRNVSQRRLHANPTAQRCIRCQRKTEARKIIT